MALSTITLPSDISLSEIRKVATPPLSALVKDGSKNECFKLISSMIVLLNEYFNIAWTNFQVASCSKEFYSNYFFWHQLDLKNFFRLCKQMAFHPKLLSVTQFSPLIFAEWAKQYNSEWLSTSEEIQRLKSDSANYDAKRETEIYNREVRLRVDEEQKEEMIGRLRSVIDWKNRQIENLQNGIG